MKGKSFSLPFRKGRLLWLPEDIGEAIHPGNLIFNGHLSATRYNVERIDTWDLGSGLVTDQGVEYLVDAFDTGTNGPELFNYHDSGTGTTAAAVGDTALVTPAGPTTRATGTKSQPAANQYRSVGTITYAGGLAITEWGLFHDATRGATDFLWDRRVFTAINVVASDSIEFTYTLTINSGG